MNPKRARLSELLTAGAAITQAIIVKARKK